MTGYTRQNNNLILDWVRIATGRGRLCEELAPVHEEDYHEEDYKITRLQNTVCTSLEGSMSALSLR